MQRIVDIFSNNKNFISDMGTFVGSEFVSKLSRLAMLVAMARALTPSEIGIAVLALALGDFFKGFTENGIGQKIIATKVEEVDLYANAAHRIYWVWCLALFIAQLLVAGTFFLITDNVLLPILIAILAGQFLWMPAGLPSCYLATRAKKLKQIAGINMFQVSCSNILSILLLLLWAHPASLILPKILTAPVWLILIKKLFPWTPTINMRGLPFKNVLTFSFPITGIEALKSLRQHADKILIGSIAGIDILGAYYFTFNAGLTLATTFTATFNFVLYPYLCAHTNYQNREIALRKYMFGAVVVIIPAVLAQALFANQYVPLIFGEEWSYIAPIIAILSVTTIPLVLWNAVAQWLRSLGRAKIELVVASILTAALILNVVAFSNVGLPSLATGFALTHFIILGISILIFIPKNFRPIVSTS